MNADSISLPEIAFFGRGLAEYEKFYGFRAAHWAGRRVLDCPAGPSSFVAEAQELGVDAVGLDPLFGLPTAEVEGRARRGFESVFAAVAGRPQLISTRTYPSIEAAREVRRRGLEAFCADFPRGRQTGRYRAGELPRLPFPDRSFDLVLCGHLLFVYGHLLDYVFHAEACLELLRVSRGEVRIHPLIGTDGTEHRFVRPLLGLLADLGVRHRVIEVDFEFFRGTTRTLILEGVRAGE